MKRSIRMQEKDNVATLLEDAAPGDMVGIFDQKNCLLYEIFTKDKIPFGNKIALRSIATGEKVVKYGGIIGESVRDIEKGTLVHVHNVKSLKVDIPPAFKKEIMRQMGYDMEGKPI